MSSLTIRRIIVWAVSSVLGIAVSLAFLTFVLPAVSPSLTAEAISFEEYGEQYFFWTAFPITLIFVTLLDHFMDTRIWPN